MNFEPKVTVIVANYRTHPKIPPPLPPPLALASLSQDPMAYHPCGSNIDGHEDDMWQAPFDGDDHDNLSPSLSSSLRVAPPSRGSHPEVVLVVWSNTSGNVL